MKVEITWYSTSPQWKGLVLPVVQLYTMMFLGLFTPEYQAAARLMLTTTSTGTRSARALLEARIVRRIPFPAAIKRPLGPLKLSIHP